MKTPIILLHKLIHKESVIMLAYYLARQRYFVAVSDLLFGASKNSVKSGGKLNFNTFFTEMEQHYKEIECIDEF